MGVKTSWSSSTLPAIEATETPGSIFASPPYQKCNEGPVKTVPISRNLALRTTSSFSLFSITFCAKASPAIVTMPALRDFVTKGQARSAASY
mmetsp:Transcript_2799/g.5408  ORF Transcript_2799/g.5408 Transcript_2799/m.5408 type:complete len:92 (-) Transcript_2799:269-544(-)